MTRYVPIVCLFACLASCQSPGCTGGPIQRWYGYASDPPPPVPQAPPKRVQSKVIMAEAPPFAAKDMAYSHYAYILTDDGCLDGRGICEGVVSQEDIRHFEGGLAIFAPACTLEREDVGGRVIERHWTIFYPVVDEPGRYTAHMTSDVPGLDEARAFRVRMAPFCPFHTGLKDLWALP
jgi:hypothetical protein